MLTAKVLSPFASLNSFKIIDSIDFFPGTSLNVVLRIYNPDEGDRYIPPSTCVPTVLFNQASGVQLAITPTLNTDDRSIMSMSLTPAQTATLIGGNIEFSLDLLGDGTQIMIGLVQNGITKITIDS